MTKFRALLMSGACLGLLMLQASSDHDGRNIADTIKARIAKWQQFGVPPSPVRLAQAEHQTNDSEKSGGSETKPPAAVPASAGVTSYYGGGQADAGTPAWAAEATVFATVAAAGAAPSAPASEIEAAQPAPAAAAEAAPAPAAASAVGVTSHYGDGAPAEGQAFSAPATVFETVADAPAAPAAAPTDAPQEAAKTEAAQGVTSYYGDTAPADGQPFSAPATVFITVDEKPAEAAPVAAPAAAAAPEKVAEPPKVNYVESNPGPAVPGVTSYYGGSTQRAEDQPYSAPAKMVTEAPAAIAPASAAASSCRDQLAATVQAGRILFANSSFEIRPESFRTLDKLAAIAKGCSGVSIEIGGHTDNTGSPAGNTQLSLLRAQAVLTYLVKEGVDKAKLKAVGFGQTSPLATNTTAEGRQKNRRIEFVVSGG